MKKAWYAFRNVLPMFRARILMLWFFLLYTSFLLSYFFSIYQTQQAFLGNAPTAERMQSYLLVSTTAYANLRADQYTARRESMESLEGVEKLERIYVAVCRENGATTFAYPSDMLNQMDLRDESNRPLTCEMQAEEGAYPVWVDSRLKHALPIGTPLSFTCLSATGDQASPLLGSYRVVGYLNRDHFSLTWGGLTSVYPNLMDIMATGYGGMSMITVSDAVDGDPAYDTCMPPVLCLRTEGTASAHVDFVRSALQKKGIGTCYTYEEVVYNTKQNIRPFLYSTAASLCYLLPMSLLAMFGMQQLLISRLRHTRAVLQLCGMTRDTWTGAWLLVLCFMTALPSVLGYTIFVAAQRLNLIYPLSGAVAPSAGWIAVILLIQYVFGLLGLIPTLRRDKQTVSAINEDGGAL